MKVVILAGGFGTRLSEETVNIPKPMVNIGEKPILWHIMKTYSHYGYNDFVICLGYKGYIIKEYFMNYFMHMSDITVDLTDGGIKVHNSEAEDWKITLVDTGLNTMTGGRIKRVKEYLNDETFMLTYGDGVADVNIKELVNYHKEHGKLATLTSVQPSGRFGALTMKEKGKVESFIEKPAGDGAWINGGFFVLEPEVIDYITDDTTVWEREPLEKLSKDGELYAYKHKGFWKPMDTLRDKNDLEKLWQEGIAPWKIW
jgi:glucose-1-phosphate cytidylyltransferase